MPVVTRLDRLARSTRDFLNTPAAIAAKGRAFVLTVSGGLAEFERELIRARTGEGRERAKARRQHLGRLPKLTPHQRAEAIRRREKGEETLAEIGRTNNVSPQTIGRL